MRSQSSWETFTDNDDVCQPQSAAAVPTSADMSRLSPSATGAMATADVAKQQAAGKKSSADDVRRLFVDDVKTN